MITEVLLVLSLYLILFFIWWQFRHLIKIMADVGELLNDDEIFGDAADAPKEVLSSTENKSVSKMS